MKKPCDTICHGLYGEEVRESCTECVVPYGLTVGSVLDDMYRAQTAGIDMPEYTRTQFETWISTRPDFARAYSRWANAAYEKGYRPVVNKLDLDRPWGFDNLVVGVAHSSGLSKAVTSTNAIGVSVTYRTIASAARNTGATRAQISKCCGGEAKTAAGLKWEYAN